MHSGCAKTVQSGLLKSVINPRTVLHLLAQFCDFFPSRTNLLDDLVFHLVGVKIIPPTPPISTAIDPSTAKPIA